MSNPLEDLADLERLAADPQRDITATVIAQRLKSIMKNIMRSGGACDQRKAREILSTAVRGDIRDILDHLPVDLSRGDVRQEALGELRRARDVYHEAIITLHVGSEELSDLEQQIRGWEDRVYLAEAQSAVEQVEDLVRSGQGNTISIALQRADLALQYAGSVAGAEALRSRLDNARPPALRLHAEHLVEPWKSDPEPRIQPGS